MRAMKAALMMFGVSIACWGIAGIVAYFGMAFIPGITEAQRDLVIPGFLLGGVILAVYKFVTK